MHFYCVLALSTQLGHTRLVHYMSERVEGDCAATVNLLEAGI